MIRMLTKAFAHALLLSATHDRCFMPAGRVLPVPSKSVLIPSMALLRSQLVFEQQAVQGEYQRALDAMKRTYDEVVRQLHILQGRPDPGSAPGGVRLPSALEKVRAWHPWACSILGASRFS